MDDIECPYCGNGQEVCNDDGFGYAEDRRHEDECGKCGKNFVFTTSISFDYYPEKADCLNGSEHQLKMSGTYPKQYSKMDCQDCDYRRQPTPAEFKEAGIVIPSSKAGGAK